MDFRFTDDHLLLADGVREFLAGECTSDHVADAWQHGPSPARWKALAGLGLVGLLVPEEHGGMGMDEVDLCLPLEHAGWAGLPEPLVEVAAVAAPLLADLGGEAATLLGPVAAGEQVVVPALEQDRFPAHVASADHVLVQRDSEVLLVAPAELRTTPQPNVDHARPTVSVDDVPTDARVLADDAGEALRRAGDRGAWASAAFLVGAGRRCIDLATAYALEREQFGRPIGSFQAVKHHLATALVAVEFARPLVHRAAWSLANGDADASLHASMAKARAAEAAKEAAKAALQVHGAIGYTWEHPLHLWMKRIWSLAPAWGDTEHHWQRIEGRLVG